MKRFLLLMPVMIQPYILLFALYSIFINQYIVERFFGGNGLWLLFVIFVTIVISFICTLEYMPLCLAKGWGARQTAFFNMLIKLVQIPAYLAIFVLGVLFFLTIFTYAFSVFLGHPQINGQEIILENKRFEMNMTIENYETAITLYNAFNHQKNKKFLINQNSWKLQNIVLIPEKEIKENKIIIKFQAPLCVRKRENKKDYYYSFESEGFAETLKLNIKEQLKITNIAPELVDTFKITPIKAKKVIIKFYEKQIECSTVIFELEGDVELLNYLYKAGIGSKHSAGFGMFQIV